MGHERLTQEQGQRAENFNTLESLEGFPKLSGQQQRMIRASLYIQDRADRDHTYNGEYPTASRHIKDEFCHSAAFSLENEIPLGRETDEAFGQGYFSKEARDRATLLAGVKFLMFPTVPEVNELVEQTGFPALVVVGEVQQYDAAKRTSISEHTHTCVALGKDSEGTIIVWEKRGYHLPYHLCPLNEVYARYAKSEEWGVRAFGRKTTA